MKHTASIWHEAPGEHLVDLSRYSDDFQVMVHQLLDEGLELPGDFHSVVVEAALSCNTKISGYEPQAARGEMYYIVFDPTQIRCGRDIIAREAL